MSDDETQRLHELAVAWMETHDGEPPNMFVLREAMHSTDLDRDQTHSLADDDESGYGGAVTRLPHE